MAPAETPAETPAATPAPRECRTCVTLRLMTPAVAHGAAPAVATETPGVIFVNQGICPVIRCTPDSDLYLAKDGKLVHHLGVSRTGGTPPWASRVAGTWILGVVSEYTPAIIWVEQLKTAEFALVAVSHATGETVDYGPVCTTSSTPALEFSRMVGLRSVRYDRFTNIARFRKYAGLGTRPEKVNYDNLVLSRAERAAHNLVRTDAVYVRRHTLAIVSIGMSLVRNPTFAVSINDLHAALVQGGDVFDPMVRRAAIDLLDREDDAQAGAYLDALEVCGLPVQEMRALEFELRQELRAKMLAAFENGQEHSQ